jgi:hypothetical protein
MHEKAFQAFMPKFENRHDGKRTMERFKLRLIPPSCPTLTAAGLCSAEASLAGARHRGTGIRNVLL